MNGNEPPESDEADEIMVPSPQGAAMRAMVLCTVVGRAYLELYGPGKSIFQFLSRRAAEKERSMMREAIEISELEEELEPDERELLETPFGRADKSALVRAAWRAEGLALLAWALQRYEIPPYDQRVPEDDIIAQGGRLTVGSWFAFLMDENKKAPWESAELRPESEIGKYASHITIVNWRLTTFRMSPEQTKEAGINPKRMDFVGFLRAHPSFKETWLDGLRIIGGDLAIGDKAIGDAPEEEVYRCMSIAVERQIAAYWLQGDNEVYSKVVPATILMGLP